MDTNYSLAENVRPGERRRLMLFPIGTWHTKKYGQLPLTNEMADRIITNFHNGVLEETEPFLDSGRHDESSPATAWFKELFKAPYRDPKSGRQGTALWAEAEFTPEGADLYNSRKFRYISPVLAEHTITKTGEKVKPVLRSATPTNIPVLRAMPSVVESEEWLSPVMADEGTYVDFELAEESWPEAEDLPDSAFAFIEPGTNERYFPMRDLAGKLDEALVRQDLADLSEADLPAPVSERVRATLLRAADELGFSEEYREATEQENDMKDLAKLLALAEDADEAAIITAITALQGHVTELETANVALSEQVTTLTDEKRQAEELRLAEKRDTILDALINGGHIAPAQKDGYIALAERDFELFEQMTEAAKQFTAVDLKDHGKHESGDFSTPEVPEDPSKALAEMANALCAADSTKTFEDAISEVLKDPKNTELAEAYQRFVYLGVASDDD